MTKRLTIGIFICVSITSYSQNVGVGTPAPVGKLHVKGAANVTQLVIDANNTQSNINPLIRLRSGAGNDLLWLHSDNALNTFLGFNAGSINDANGGAVNNTYIGNSVGFATTSGGANTGIGAKALFSNITGNNNTAVGVGALYSNSLGSGNTATGTDALELNVSGVNNTANGASALFFNTGSNNTAIGNGAMFFTTSSNYNTATGFNSLYRTATSQYNTAIGYQAGFGFNMGFNNTILGANCDVNQNGLFNCVGIGQAVTNTASNQARIGNASTNSIGGYANWTNISDGRFKRNIHENVPGIDFIMKLRPVTYYLDIAGISKELNEGRGKEIDEYSRTAINEKQKTLYSGFVAQEVEIAAKQVGYDFSGVDKPKNDKDFYGLRYAEFVVPLVKAVQEQQLMIEDLQKQPRSGTTVPVQTGLQEQTITDLQKKIALLEEQNRLLKQLLTKKSG